MKRILAALSVLVFASISFGDTLVCLDTNPSANADTTTTVCSTNVTVKSVTVVCSKDNTQHCVVGDSNISHASNIGMVAEPGGFVEITASEGYWFGSKGTIDCGDVYFEVGVNSEEVSVCYLK